MPEINSTTQPPLPTHRKFRDITDRRFNRLVARQYLGMKKGRGAEWLCACNCGQSIRVKAVDLISGNTGSCGCWKSEQMASRNTTHGLSKRPEYRIWAKMIERCESPKAAHYDRYGGRGIKVCERWRSSFENFLADMGERPPSTEIDRVDNDGNYEPENCRWVTKQVNARNRYTNRILEFNGLRLCVPEWSDKMGIKAKTIHDRLIAGWSVADALTRPVKHQGRAA